MTYRNPARPEPIRNFPMRVCASVLEQRLAEGWQPFEALDRDISNPDAVGGVEKFYGISWPYPWPPTDPMPEPEILNAVAALGGE